MSVIIGLTGHKGSGKDEVAKVLVRSAAAVQIKFSGGLKTMLGALLSYRGQDGAMIERHIEGDLKEVPCPALGGQTPRYAMQTIGTEWGRDLIHGDLWIGATVDRIRAEFPKHVVITDVRFHNEAQAVRDLGGEIWRVVRDGCSGDGHISERQMNEIEVDETVYNYGTLEDLYRSTWALFLKKR